MNIAEVRRHRAHMCDVFSDSPEVIGVIARVKTQTGEADDGTVVALVSGHPSGSAWVDILDLETGCKIAD